MRTSLWPTGLWQPGDDPHPPWLLHVRSSKWFILMTVALAVFTDIFLYSVIVPVLPFALRTRAHVEESEVQSWVSILIAVYGGALAISSPISGWLADHSSSRRLPLVLGLVALGGATILLNLGPNIGILILGRVLQGISAAIVWTVGLALLADTVPQSEIGQTMGYVFAAMSVGMLLGPLLGGVVFEKGGYNEVYAMAYVLIGVDIALRLFMIEKKVAKKWQTSDRLSTGGIDLNSVLEPEKSASPTPTAVNVATPSVPARQRSRYPPVITLLKSRRLLCALWGCLVVAILMTQFDSVLPLYVRDTFHWSSTGAGLIFLPLILPAFIAPLVGWAIDKYGGRWFCAIGFLAFAPFEVLLRLVDHNSLKQKVLLSALLFLIGFSLNLCTPPLMVEITAVVEKKERESPGLFGSKGAYAQAYGLFNLAFAGGCLVGPLWAGFVNERASWGTMAWSLALLSALTAVPAFIWTEGYLFEKGRKGWSDRSHTPPRGAEQLA
ncbi:MFS transporter-like protein [Tothia fuscella]|uniref:MFS transporter-like protein n=1 Tax=Tothia fuscella TaxID=1048955 RepID=A0A9P4NPP8_9PEZI|nr:MFS transporter-like protein [Tothia fuscella]